MKVVEALVDGVDEAIILNGRDSAILIFHVLLITYNYFKLSHTDRDSIHIQ